MTTPLWVLLAFAVWTVLVLLAGVGVHRWSRTLSRAGGTPVYRRAVRAHANCVENLPVYGAVAVVAAIAGIDTPGLDRLAIVFLVARIGQTLTHMLFRETNTTVGIRFGFFAIQVLAVLWMAAIVASAAWPAASP